MAWVEIKIQTQASQADKVSHAYQELGALAVTTQDAGDQPLYEPKPGTIPIWDEVVITGLFEESPAISEIITSLQNEFKDLSFRVTALQDQDWERTWMADFEPMPFGNRLWIVPSFESNEIHPNQVVLDPGLAFGTGKHPTTALCLRWLDKFISGGEVIIDYGCGSGILGIAALKLGAQKVYAIDYDPQAILATEENAKKNYVTDQVITSSPDDKCQIKADILMANILANPLIELAGKFADFLPSSGKLILSGILEEQTSSVLDAYKLWFDINAIDQEQEWMLISASRK